ncbi:hypothetical protein HII12_002773 [Brettanomyces bruxellensis]|uniref:Mitochondrial peculiar membrane protein 1 n=1 Tax=Dekkera bruxellensis TaxID=5007 RepID=A0A8H6BFB1_DEKBR|nr:hypothetical protein HII12_002773 [Brettanomyces bruxellensis]
MGLYDPSKDKNLPVKAEDIEKSSFEFPLSDPVRSLFSKTNDIASSSFNKMLDFSKNIFGSDDDSQYSVFDDSFSHNPFFNTFRSLYGSASRPNGFVTYPVPSVELYSKCKKMDGLEAWDSRGYWHCIFPRAKIPEEVANDPEGYSKEDVEGDFDHKKYGIFFTNFNDLMDWQSKMREVMKSKREKEWSKYRTQEKSKWDFLNGDKPSDDNKVTGPFETSDNTDVYNVPSTEPGDKNFFRSTGTSSSTIVNTLENGDIEKTTSVKRYFGDGTSEEREYKEIIDGETGKSKKVDQKVAKYPNHSSLKKGGWFWSKKDKNNKKDEDD